MDIKRITSKRPILKQLLYMLAVSILIIVVAFYALKIYSRHGKEYEVPAIVGLTLADLDTIPKSNYFEYVVIDSIFIPGKQGGEILSQDPYPHSKVKKGRKFYITISAFSPESVSVPNLIDLTVRQAISQLASIGLQGGKLIFVEDMARNAVLKQTVNGEKINSGELLTRGSMVDLVVGRGNSSNTMIPLVLGKTPEDARRDILSASLNVGKEIFENGAIRTESRVYKQSPSYSGRNSAELGTKIDLWYRSEKSTNFDKVLKEFKPDTTSVETDEEDEESIEGNW